MRHLQGAISQPPAIEGGSLSTPVYILNAPPSCPAKEAELQCKSICVWQANKINKNFVFLPNNLKHCTRARSPMWMYLRLHPTLVVVHRQNLQWLHLWYLGKWAGEIHWAHCRLLGGFKALAWTVIAALGETHHCNSAPVLLLEFNANKKFPLHDN